MNHKKSYEKNIDAKRVSFYNSQIWKKKKKLLSWNKISDTFFLVKSKTKTYE